MVNNYVEELEKGRAEAVVILLRHSPIRSRPPHIASVLYRVGTWPGSITVASI